MLTSIQIQNIDLPLLFQLPSVGLSPFSSSYPQKPEECIETVCRCVTKPNVPATNCVPMSQTTTNYVPSQQPTTNCASSPIFSSTLATSAGHYGTQAVPQCSTIEVPSLLCSCVPKTQSAGIYSLPPIVPAKHLDSILSSFDNLSSFKIDPRSVGTLDSDLGILGLRQNHYVNPNFQYGNVLAGYC